MPGVACALPACELSPPSTALVNASGALWAFFRSNRRAASPPASFELPVAQRARASISAAVLALARWVALHFPLNYLGCAFLLLSGRRTLRAWANLSWWGHVAMGLSQVACWGAGALLRRRTRALRQGSEKRGGGQEGEGVGGREKSN